MYYHLVMKAPDASTVRPGLTAEAYTATWKALQDAGAAAIAPVADPAPRGVLRVDEDTGLAGWVGVGSWVEWWIVPLGRWVNQ